MAATHTSGPWSVAHRKGQAVIRGPQTECLAALPYAPCEGYGLTSIFEIGANARLIAAAPEMLAALQEIERGLANTHSTPGEWRTLIRKDDAWRIASAAIAKATGAGP